MKKLMSLFGSVVLGAAPVMSVIACSNDDTYDSQTWAWLPGLKDGETITSTDVWENITPFSPGGDIKNPMSWDASTRATYLHQILLIFDVSLLATAKDYSDNPDDHDNAWYKMLKGGNIQPEKPNYLIAIQNLQKDFSRDWDDLTDEVNQEVKNKKDEYKDDYGNKWDREWKDFLKDYDDSEENYKADLMLEGDSTNATVLVNDELQDYGKTGYRIASSSNITENYISITNADEENGTATNDVFTDDVDGMSDNTKQLMREVVLSMKSYDSSDPSDADYVFWEQDRNGTLTPQDYQDEFKAIITGQETIDLSGDIKFNVPAASLIKDDQGQEHYVRDVVNDANNKPTSETGLASTAQIFELNKWFKNYKPIEYTSQHFDFDSGKTIDSTGGIQEDSFNSATRTDVTNIIQNNNTPPDLYSTNTTYLTLDSITQDDPDDDTISSNGIGDSNPVTINIDGLNAIYNFLCTDPADLNDKVVDYGTLISKLDRKTTDDANADGSYDYDKQHMFAFIPDPGDTRNATIAYIDDSGLNFITILGYDYEGSTPYDPDGTGNSSVDDTIDVTKEYDNLQQAMGNFPDSWDPATDYDNMVAQFNNGIENNYLRYLYNDSFAQTLNRDVDDFYNPVMEANNYASFDTTTDLNDESLWSMYIYDYIDNLEINSSHDTNTIDNWFQDFISISDIKDGTDVTVTIENLIENLSAQINSYYSTNLIQSIQSGNDTLDSKSSSYPEEQFKIPNWDNYIFND